MLKRCSTWEGIERLCIGGLPRFLEEGRRKLLGKKVITRVLGLWTHTPTLPFLSC